MFSSSQQNGYITFGGIQTRAFDPSNPTHPGNTPDDYLVHSLRVLIFNTAGGCVDNVYYYGSAVSETMVHPIKEEGTYKFVFLANEPSLTNIKSQLENIQEYADLQKIAYPAETFDSDKAIPMISQDDNIVILANGKFKVGSGGTEQNVLTINFRRLAIRLDVTLLSVMNLENQDPATEKAFKGVTLSNLPDKVPLVWGLPNDRPAANAEYLDPSLSFEGSTPVEWELDQKRTFTLENGDFGSETLTSEEQAEGYVWKRTLNRVVLPASYFTSKSDKGNAVQVTVNTNAYNPSCELKMKDNDYTLPANSKLDLRGIVKEPIEVNIIASPWDSVASN